MIMKKLAVFFFLAVISMFCGKFAFAQGKYGADSAECIKYLSYYQEYYKQKNYDAAIPNWRKAFSLCPPTANQNMLVQGTTLVRQLINQNASNPEYKQALIDSLMMLHDTRAQYYPKVAVTALNNKALDMINYIKDDDQALFDGLSEIAKVNGVSAKPNVYFFMVNSAVNLYNKGVFSAEKVIEVYEFAIENLAQIEQDSPSEELTKLTSDVENLFISSKVADCDQLVELFTPRFNADPNSLELSSNIVRMLSLTEGCTDKELFVQAAATMHRLEPSHTSAYFMYKIYSNRGEVDNAEEMMLQAINSDATGEEQDADYYFELAAFMVRSGKTAKAYNYAVKAVQLDNDKSIAGRAYLLMGTIWGSTVCQGNEIEQRAPYWVATDYMLRAKAADPSLGSECDKYLAQYRSFFPATADAFMYDVTDGQSYTVNCGGMTASTTVRTQK